MARRKQCLTCRAEKTLTEFYVYPSGRLCPYCRPCMSERQKALYELRKQRRANGSGQAKRLTDWERIHYRALVDSAHRIRSILTLEPADCYGAIDVQEMHQSRPYRLMQEALEAAEKRAAWRAGNASTSVTTMECCDGNEKRSSA